MRIIAIYPGRFQPFGKNHKSAYDELSKIFGVENTFIATSDKTGENSPFNFNEKKKIIEKFGIPKKNIILTKNPYKADEITSKFDVNSTAVVFMYGKKDADRIRFKKTDGTDGYFKKYEHGKQLNPISKNGYIFVTESSVQMDSIGTISGTVMRRELKNASPQKFKELMGWYDQDLYELIKDRLNENNNLKKEEMIYELLLGESNISVTQLRDIESYADKLFKEFGIDVELQDASRSHFFYRLNDPRNSPPISYFEIRDIFRKAAKKYGNLIASKYDGFSAVLKDMASNINIPFMISIDKKNKEIDLIPKTVMRKKDFLNREKSLYLDEGYVIVEGGAAGHLMHPWDNNDLSFLDLLEIIQRACGGKLDSERYISEKPDGQNLMVTYKNGKLGAARNKTTLQHPLTSNELFVKFENVPETVRNIFTIAMRDLENAFKNLPLEYLTEIFGNGNKFINLEILHPDTRNVINYKLQPSIQLHGIFEYDENWNVKQIYPNVGEEIVIKLKEFNSDKQSTFQIISHNKITLPEIPSSYDVEDNYISSLKSEMQKYGLNFSSTIDDYRVAKWEIIIDEKFPNISNELKNILLNRWARKIPQRISKLECGNYFDLIKKFDIEESKKINMTILKPLEQLFLSLGTLILKNVDNLMTADKNASVDSLRVDILTAIEKVENSEDQNLKDSLAKQLSRIEDIGGLTNIVPTEGIVFIYKGNEYKLTGLFSPINQIMGFLKYSNRK